MINEYTFSTLVHDREEEISGIFDPQGINRFLALSQCVLCTRVPQRVPLIENVVTILLRAATRFAVIYTRFELPLE